MAKYRINYNTLAHGAISWHHEGKDSQYCEAGDLVTLDWQPTAGWGLKEAHYTDTDGNVTPITGGAFTMPAKDITIEGTFKRFALDDWAGDKDVTKGPLESIGSFGKDELPKLEGDDAIGTLAFVKDTKKYATWNGNYWTYFDGKPVVPQWLKFTANEDSSSVGCWYYSENASVVDAGKQVEYSTDGVTWQPYTIGNADNDETPTMIALDKGESVMFRGVNPNGLAFYVEDDSDYEWLAFVINGSIAASGDVTSLINEVGGDVVMHNSDLRGMFNGCTGLTAAPTLPAITLADSCYSSMFYGCTGLTTAPALPATTLAYGCYSSMFNGCTGLTAAPSLPATTLAYGCYSSMFNGCTGLTAAPSLPATTLADYCYSSMFYGCTGLTTAPALPATTLAEACYSSMFYGCTGLTTAPALPATTLAEACYNSMFYGCTGITSHHVATLNNSANVFNSNSSCDTFTIDAATPPTIGSSTITGLKASCVIYVPAASVDAYKAAQYWSARSSYIQAKP